MEGAELAAKRTRLHYWIALPILACATLVGVLHAADEAAPTKVAPTGTERRSLDVSFSSLQFPNTAHRARRSGAQAIEQTSRVHRAAQRFESRLIPRVAVELQSLSVLRGVDMPGLEPQDQVLYSEMSETVLHGAERVTRKAIKNVLIDAIDLERKLDNVKMQIAGPRTDRSGVRFDLGFHSAVPELSMRYQVGQGQVKLEVDAQGGLGLQYRRRGMERTEIHIGYDGGDYYQLGYIIAF